jgi:hypothetical protein
MTKQDIISSVMAASTSPDASMTVKYPSSPSPQPSSPTAESESHRIYWQQWLSSNEKSTGSRREWVTSSAAVRISQAARAVDVTGLLRESLQLNPLTGQSHESDALVLVGTLYSLSRDYVRFEHEADAKQKGVGENGRSSSAYAFNVCITLRPGDYPLQIRDRMADHLRRLQAEATVGRTIIAPKLQWYYCPAQSQDGGPNETSIPSCINLEGYCTSMEEDEEDWGYDEDEEREKDSCENDSLDAGPVQDMDLLASRFPWLVPEKSDLVAKQSADMSSRQMQWKRHFRQENRRLHVLSAFEAAIPQGTLSGFLLKRSSKDMHVWRRVHCVLTDDFLWFVSRRYTKYSLGFAKHGRVRLTRALILEPSSDYAPLYRTPYAFEMVAADGTSHIFRAANRALQRRWIKSVSDRIIQSYENSLLESAQLIVDDGCVAQARRMEAAVDQLWERVQGHEHVMTSSAIGRVLRWTLKVTDFRDFCRHVRSTLPAKSPVVVTSPLNRQPLSRESSADQRVSLDPLVQSTIRAAWQQATALLQEATEVGQSLPGIHRNLETLFRHVEFLLTGQRRRRSGESAPDQWDREEPPPMDLFDVLQAELQSIAASVGGSEESIA